MVFILQESAYLLGLPIVVECVVHLLQQAPIGYEVQDLVITANDDLAMTRSVNRISGTLIHLL